MTATRPHTALPTDATHPAAAPHTAQLFSLAGRTALVTGASRGLGLCMAQPDMRGRAY